mmetsp:Transcript_2582/g.2687  ORF Transcript_2582/g.2687 Transcript_2582/m.2687 type:complete len:812 (+) Transcript_2582:179-2614(+)|eukprot:CAMPEP_0119037582 /NCGR_PEP_ID=MMETSP1177-20130426/6021_1 /TAXON_ID=2985 /ORGANISM="Ochromonas sp, Strain CCMP1899" /LENGTH=811 /DNA_ID=CAMNT_0006999059 /DNA_START=151 /DNA_END=2586 /DNA_ORIENTATION=-
MISVEEERLLKENKDVEPVKAFLLAALVSKSKGDGYNYSQVVNQIRMRQDQDMVATVFIGLGSCVSQFTQRPDQYRELIQSIFSYDWTCNHQVTLAYVQLLGHIISSNVTFLVPAFHMLVKNLVPVTHAVAETLDEAQQSMAHERQQRIHKTLRGLIALVPTGQSELFPVIAEHFPHKRFAQNIQCEYITQLLHICKYLPILQQRILDIIINQCLEIDVEIIIEDSGEVKIEVEDGFIGDDAFPVAEDEIIATRNYTEGSQYIPEEVAEMAEKLDKMLYLLLEFISSEILLGNEHIEKLSKNLMAIFEERILCTHRSKFVQFVLFYFASKVEKFGSVLGSRLVRLFLDESLAHHKRQSAILYLASYTARANFLPVQNISDILLQLLTWAESYVIKSGTEHVQVAVITPNNSSSALKGDKSNKENINKMNDTTTASAKATGMYSSGREDNDYDDCEDEDGNVDLELDEYGRHQSSTASKISRHETFFSCVQACCYIVCFYGIEIAMLQKNIIMQKKWSKIITCQLLPLNFCLQSVRLEFLRLAQYIDMFEKTIWDVLGVDGMDGGHDDDHKKTNVSMGAGSNPLDSFFPYDPCLLRTLHQPIEVYYRSWKGIPGLDDLDNEDGDGDGGVDLKELGGGRGEDMSIKKSVSSSFDDEDGSEDSGDDSDTEMQSLSSMLSSVMTNPQSSSTRVQEDDGRSRVHGSTSISMTESMGLGLLEDRDKEREKYRSADSRCQSMVSDYSVEDESPPTTSFHYSAVINQKKTEKNIQGKRGHHDEGGDRVTVDSTSQLNESGWPKPGRRPRQYSVGSTGSW